MTVILPRWLSVLVEDLGISFTMTCDEHRATRQEREDAAEILCDEIIANIPDDLERLLET